jgi:hypothetical protein
MKKVLLLSIIAAGIFFTTKVNAQQGFGTNQPDKTAAVDIVATKRGLLIPRIALTDTKVWAPIISQPANSLMVYNTTTSAAVTATSVTAGYYYWVADADAVKYPNGGYWAQLLSSNTKISVTNLAPGTNGQVLVTKDVAGVLTPTWVDPFAFINDTFKDGNGTTYIPATATTKAQVDLGGTLTKAGATTIATTGATNSLAITGLDNVGTAFDPAAQNIVIMGADGILKQVSAANIIGNTIKATNGVNIDATTKDIKLGGALTDVGTATTAGTTITTDAAAFKTLAIAGLAASTTPTTDKIVVVDATTNIVKTTTLAQMAGDIWPTSVDYTVLDNIQTVLVTATADRIITLPAADATNKGRIIRVKKVAGAEDFYVTVKSSSTVDNIAGATGIYGALINQGWEFQSDGVSNWVAVARY